MVKPAHAKARKQRRITSSRRRGSANRDSNAATKPRIAPTTPAKPADAELNRDTPSLLVEDPAERITDAIEPGPAKRRRDEPVEWLEEESDSEESIQ